uniref:Spo0E family sporulation regulatory protein-aspartic acid phosphatase n=1 Tax=Roseburia sp. TaxID=2049040 RepID=UPI003FEDC65A
MNKVKELQKKIEIVRLELDEALLQKDKFDMYYQKSTELDKLIEEYLETMEKCVSV